MKNYLIRKRDNNNNWEYLQYYIHNPPSIDIQWSSLIGIVNKLHAFETYHEAISFKSKHLGDKAEVVNCYDVLVELMKERVEKLKLEIQS
jgi:hypothetical protein